MARNGHILFRCAFAALVLPVLLLAGTRVAVSEEKPETNLAVMQNLTEEAGRRMARQIPQTDSVTVSLALRPESVAWITRAPIARGLSTAGFRIMESDGRFQADCSVAEMRVAYENPRRDGFLGPRLLDRVVAVRIDGMITDRSSGTVISTQRYDVAQRDTIESSAVPQLEDPSVPVTHGTLPSEGFFSWVAEPLIMIGAVAVSVYLLFHVRS